MDKAQVPIHFSCCFPAVYNTCTKLCIVTSTCNYNIVFGDVYWVMSIYNYRSGLHHFHRPSCGLPVNVTMITNDTAGTGHLTTNHLVQRI